MDITNDLSQFGYRELAIAGKLLTQYAERPTESGLGDGVAVWFNKNSGCVFLCDEDYNTAMLNGDKLEKFYDCPICGHEGFKEDMQHNTGYIECQEYLVDIGVNAAPITSLTGAP